MIDVKFLKQRLESRFYPHKFKLTLWHNIHICLVEAKGCKQTIRADYSWRFMTKEDQIFNEAVFFFWRLLD